MESLIKWLTDELHYSQDQYQQLMDDEYSDPYDLGTEDGRITLLATILLKINGGDFK